MKPLFAPYSILTRTTAGLLVMTQLVATLPMSLWSQQSSTAPASRQVFTDLPDTFKEDWVPPAPVLTPKEIVLNKAAPVSPPILELPKGRMLSREEIAQAKVLDTPLRATGGKQASDMERQKLGELLQAQVSARGMEDFQSAARLKTFVASHPGSGYNTSLLIEAAEVEWRHGFFMDTLATLQQAWNESNTLQAPDDRRLSEMALGRLLERRSLLGQKTELKALIDEVKDRNLGGYAADALVRAKEVMWFLDHKAERNVFCGFTAANAICVPLGERPIFPDVHDENEKAVFIRDGLSAFELKAHSHEAGGSLRVVKRETGDLVVVPSVVHWKFSHYSAITEKSPEGQYRVTDDHLRYDSWVVKRALEEQMSGYFLIPQAVALPKGYVEVSDEVARTIFGRHCVHARDPEGCPFKGGGNGKNCPMATYSFNQMNPGLLISDTPIHHRPPYGLQVMFEINYDQRSVAIADLSTLGNFGPRWTHSYAEAVSLTGSGTPNTQVKWILGNGSYFQYTYNSTTQTYGQAYKDRPQLTYLTSAQGGPGYRLTFSDGSKKIFKQPNATTPTKYLLTQIVDSIGNTLTLQYDGQMRLTAILDALSQATTLGYTPEAGDNVATDTTKIRQITDPFSRVAKFKYTATGQLQKIVDPVGITSEFRYAEGDFIDRIVTPYGPFEFTQGDLPGINSEPGRFMESKDAQGYRERVEANDLALPTTYVATPEAPTSVSVNGANVSFLPKNDNLFYRNTFYWDRQQMHWYPNDYSKCRIYNWLTSTADTITPVLGSIKEPLEGRVWFNYQGQTSSHAVGNVGSPSKIVRAVENSTGATEWSMSQSSYNDLGLLTGTIDQEGRELKYEYHPNHQDVQYVKVKNGTNWETLKTFSQYKTIAGVSLNLPEISSDASGLQTQNAYNDKGQITQKTLSKGGNSETTRYIYDNNLDGTPDAYGYLIRIEHTSPSNPALFVVLQSFTYDSVRRMRTVTDEQGYTRTFDYNSIDLVTLVTHPDNTTEQFVYADGARQTLDVWAAKDRAGRWTRLRYSQHRQLVMELDPLLRLTQYAWCLCGQVRELKDAMGKITSWKRDAQGRVTEKALSDGGKYLYTFQPLSGRVATIAYPKDVLNSQTTLSYAYHLGGGLEKLDYTDATMADVSYGMVDYLGRSTSVTDGVGTTNFSYVPLTGSPNGAGNPLSVDGPWANDTIRYGYDWRSRSVKNEIVADDGVTVSRSEEATLDVMGRPTQIANNLGTFSRTYASGNLTELPNSVTLPGGFSTDFTRYAANAGANALRLQTIHHKQGVNTVQKLDYVYDLGGNITSWSRTNATGNVTAWALLHDSANQLSELEESLDSVPQKKESWHYDAAGNLTSTVSIPAGQTGALQIRTLAGRNQLGQMGGTGKALVEGTVNEAVSVKVNNQEAQVTKLGPSGTWRFQKEMTFPAGASDITVEAKDGNSNITTNTYSVSVGASADQTLEYDANGNLVVVKDNSNTVVREYEWDAKNRLLAIQSPGAVANGTKRTEFSYDGKDRRVGHLEKLHNGTAWVAQSSWKYVWDGLELVQKRDASTNNVLVNYFKNGEQQGSDAFVYQPDHLGSVQNWYRVSDGAVGDASFSAYGQRNVIATGPGVPERGYTGHLHHAASGLVLAPFRAYDPGLARWLSEDPIGENGGLNLYAYVANSPLGRKDSLGLADAPVIKDPDIGRPTGKSPPGDCGSYAAEPAGPTPNCRTVDDNAKCNADEYVVIRYDVPGREAPHIIRQDEDGTYSHQTGINGQIYDQVKDPAKAAACYFKHQGNGKNAPLEPIKYCCKKAKK